MPINNLDGAGIFKDNSIPIVVLSNEHNGKSFDHTHSFYEFVYLRKGFSLHTYNGLTSMLTSGDVFAMRPGDIHGYTSANHALIYNCLFMPEALDRMPQEIMEMAGLKQIISPGSQAAWMRIHLDIKKRTLAEEYLSRMILERAEKKPGWEANLSCLLTGFLILFARAFTENYGNQDDRGNKYYRHVYNALSYIEENYMKEISVNDIAESTGLSSDYMSRQFRQFTGMTPVGYIRNFRFAKAVEMLKDPAAAISEIAFEVGYDDPCYFTRQFKKLLNMNPSEYRKLYYP